MAEAGAQAATTTQAFTSTSLDTHTDIRTFAARLSAMLTDTTQALLQSDVTALDARVRYHVGRTNPLAAEHEAQAAAAGLHALLHAL